MTRLFISRCLLIYGICCWSAPVFAADNAAHLHDKRRILAQSFVAKLKNRLGSAESPAAQTKDMSGISRIAMGTEMQFRPRVGKVRLDYDVYAVKGQDDFYLSLPDLISALAFPITIDQDARTAQGWFMREDWRFDLDLKANRVTARGNDYVITAQDYQIINDEMFFAGKFIQQWFGMTYGYHTGQQYIDIESEYPLPVIAQIKRRGQGGRNPVRQNIAQLPEQKFDYEWLDLNVADLTERTNYTRQGDGRKSDILNRGDIRLAGDFLKHDAYAFINMDDRDGLNGITTRMSRASHDPDLLGFMKARSYMMGDISGLGVPLTGDSEQGLGFRVSDNPLSGVNYQDTRISGYALPGWDVELYRDDTRVDTLIVDDTGRYEFENVQLFAGDNQFEVVFYGSQGEIRSEKINIPLNAATLSSQKNTYDFSVALQDTQTYRRIDSDEVDSGTPNIAGQYNYYVGDALAYTGFRAVQENEEQKFYLGSGLTTIWLGSILEANLAADEAGEFAGRLGVRRNIADWQTALSTQIQTDNYNPGDTTTPAMLDVQASATRRYTPPIGTGGNIGLNANYRQFSDDSESNGVSVSIGQGFNKVSLSNTLVYDRITPEEGDTTTRVSNDFSARVNVTGNLSARAGVNYRIKPESQMERYFSNVNYRPAMNLNFDASLDHYPEQQQTEGRVQANYTHEKFRFSPFLQLDNQNDLTAGFNVTTSLIDVPNQNLPLVTGERLSSQGMVSAHVYLDVNGNGLFDDGDEPISGTVVESVNSRRRANTNDSGYAMLNRLSTNILTDIRVDNSSLPDPFMIAINPGNSVLPRPGKIYEMEFPVQFSSEIDGTVFLSDRVGKKFAKFVEVSLLPVDTTKKPITAKAAQDGFFIVSQIPPGQYYMTVKGEDAQTLKSARTKPRLLIFGHEGEMLSSQDVSLIKGRRDINFSILKPLDLVGWDGSRPTAFIRIPESESTSLLNVLYRLRMKGLADKVVSGLSRYETQDAEGKPIVRYVVASGNLDDAWNRCEMMSENNLPCAVELLLPQTDTNQGTSEVPDGTIATALR
jgi:hypothetical protein